MIVAGWVGRCGRIRLLPGRVEPGSVALGELVTLGRVLRRVGPPGSGSAGGSGECAQVEEDGVELVLPGPAGRESEGVSAGSVGGNGGDGDDPGLQGSAVDGFVVAQDGGPSGEVVGDDGTGEPGGVGWVVPGWDVFSGAVFQVADGEFDDGVVAVEPVGFDGGQVVAVGDEAVMSPVGNRACWAVSASRVRRTTNRTVR